MAYTFDSQGRPIATGTPPSVGNPVQLGAGTRHTISAGSVAAIDAETGATRLELTVEEGTIRVRSDGSTATATTGEPMWPGDRRIWSVTSLSVLAVDVDSVVTSISR